MLDIVVLYLFVWWSVLDPVLKREYLDAAWDDEYIELGMESLKARVSTGYGYTTETASDASSSSHTRKSMTIPKHNHCQRPQHILQLVQYHTTDFIHGHLLTIP